MHVPKKGYGDCVGLFVRPRFVGEVCMTLTRQFRDVVLSVAGLSLLVMLLLSLNPRLRERAIAFSTSLNAERVVSGQGGEIEGHGFVRHAIDQAVSTVVSFAAGNTYLFVFLVAASVLFVAMVKT